MPWGIIFSGAFWSSIIAFLGPVISKFLQWYLTGALKSFVIQALLFAGILASINWLITFVSGVVNRAIGEVAGFAPNAMPSILAFLPTNLVTCWNIVATVYLSCVAYNIAKELIKLKARAAERAAGFMKA
jgi:hypothetical protein